MSLTKKGSLNPSKFTSLASQMRTLQREREMHIAEFRNTEADLKMLSAKANSLAVQLQEVRAAFGRKRECLKRKVCEIHRKEKKINKLYKISETAENLAFFLREADDQEQDQKSIKEAA